MYVWISAFDFPKTLWYGQLYKWYYERKWYGIESQSELGILMPINYSDCFCSTDTDHSLHR